MIKYYTKENNKTKVLEKACKKLKMDTKDVLFACYDKFLFTYLFALAIKDKTIYLFATDEGGKKDNVYSSYPLDKVKEVKIVKKTDVNLYLHNGNFINLTSMVGITKSNKAIISLINSEISKAR